MVTGTSVIRNKVGTSTVTVLVPVSGHTTVTSSVGDGAGIDRLPIPVLPTTESLTEPYHRAWFLP